MKDLPEELAKKWKVEHFEQAEAAFERVSVEGQSAAAPSFFQKSELPVTALQAKKEDMDE